MCLTGNPVRAFKEIYIAKQIAPTAYIFSRETITRPQVRGLDSTFCHSQVFQNEPGG